MGFALRLVLLAAPLTVILLAGAFAVGAYVRLQTSGEVLHGVTVAGLSLQGSTLSEAEGRIDRLWNHEQRLMLIDGQDPTRTWQAAPAEFGLSVDAASTAASAMAIGRTGGLTASVTQIWAGVRRGIELDPIVRFDPVAARAGLLTWASRVGRPPEDAQVILQDGQVVYSPGQTGWTVDIEASLSVLAADPTSTLLVYGFIPLMMSPVPPAIPDAAAAASEAARLLEARPVLRAFDPVTGEQFEWAATAAQVETWIRVEEADGTLRVRLDEAALAGFVEEQAASLGSERYLDAHEAQAALWSAFEGGVSAPLQVHYNPTSHTVGASENWVSIGVRYGFPYWVVQQANPGVTLSAGTVITIPPRDANLRVAVVPDKRIVISISEQRMWVYQDGAPIREFVVSTGISRSPTLPGLFQVQTHIPNAYASIWDLWMPDFLGIYEAVPGFWNGIHGLPLLSNGVRLWADVLGRPASYGCIILDLEASAWLYGWAEDGVVVEIRR